MGKSSVVTGQLTMGLDISDRYSHICVLDEAGEILEESRIATTPEAFRSWFSSRPRSRVALEVGTHSPWASRMLRECGHDVIIANPRKVRLIYENDGKSDRVDAELLARIARLDPKLLKPIQHRGPQAQGNLAVIRARDAMVHSRTLLINHVRGAVKPFGERVRKCSSESFAKRAGELPESLQEIFGLVLETISTLTGHIREYDRRIQALEARYPESKLLEQVSGVGVLTSIAYMLTIEDPHRFRRSRSVGSFFGLQPGKDDSGEYAPELSITKAGDPMVRRLLVGSAQYILGPFGPDTDLRRWGLALAASGKKNAKKRAVVAVARKLAVLLHHLWISGEVYEPLRNATVENEAPLPGGSR